MMKKLGVNNVAGLTQLALSAGLTRFPASAGHGRRRKPVKTPWGDIAVSDAHVHFFSSAILSVHSRNRKGIPVAEIRARPWIWRSRPRILAS